MDSKFYFRRNAPCALASTETSNQSHQALETTVVLSFSINAYAEWLWIDSKFSLSTYVGVDALVAVQRRRNIAHHVLDELGIIVRALGNVLFRPGA